MKLPVVFLVGVFAFVSAEGASCIVSGSVERLPSESAVSSSDASADIVAANGDSCEGTSAGLLSFLTRLFVLFMR